MAVYGTFIGNPGLSCLGRSNCSSLTVLHFLFFLFFFWRKQSLGLPAGLSITLLFKLKLRLGVFAMILMENSGFMEWGSISLQRSIISCCNFATPMQIHAWVRIHGGSYTWVFVGFLFLHFCQVYIWILSVQFQIGYTEFCSNQVRK